MSTTQDALTLGVEEEFQIVEAATTELVQGYETLMRGATPAIKNHLKPEFVQSVVECITDVCDDMAAVRQQTMSLRATAALLGRQSRLAIAAASTHPSGRWYDQRRTPGDRYGLLEDLLQDVARSILIYGLHIHVSVADDAQRIAVVNQARTFLPYILALSVNSPFWMGRNTGYQSYRTVVWTPFPMAGIPDTFDSIADYHQFRELFMSVNALSDTRRIWWDIRPHHVYPTVEFRVADMPLHHEDMLSLVAFIQALVKTIVTRTERGQPLPVLPRVYIEENRWRAARYGLRGNMVDFIQKREVPTTAAIGAAIDLVSDAAAELGTTTYLDHVRQMLAPSYRTGAERQIAAYKKRDDPRDVTRMLMEETLRGIDLTTAMPLATGVIAANGHVTTSANGARKGPFLRRKAPEQPQA